MKKIATILRMNSIIILICLSSSLAAQTTKQQQQSKQRSTGNSADSLKLAVANLKAFFGGKKDTIAIMVMNVDYDDSDLAQLKNCLKNYKGVKSLSAQYKSGNEIITVTYKDVSTSLWDNLPANIKKPFKLTEATDNILSLKLKNAKDSP